MTGIDEEPSLVSRVWDLEKPVSKLGALGGLAAAYMEGRGRWLRLDDESFAWLRANHVAPVTSGVVRFRDLASGGGSQIVKHLKFSGVTVSPNFVAQLALQSQLHQMWRSIDEMRVCIQSIDKKIDGIIEEKKRERFAELGGIASLLGDAASHVSAHGELPQTSWSKIAGTDQTIRTYMEMSIRSLEDLVTSLDAVDDKPDNILEAVVNTERESAYWLTVLARTVVLDDRLNALELMRVNSESIEKIAEYQQSIQDRRTQRIDKIGRVVTAVYEGVHSKASVTDSTRILHPKKVVGIDRAINSMLEIFQSFEIAAEIPIGDLTPASAKSWREAFRDASTEKAENIRGFVLDRCRAPHRMAMNVKKHIAAGPLSRDNGGDVTEVASGADDFTDTDEGRRGSDARNDE